MKTLFFRATTTVLALLLGVIVHAHEGMWIPSLLNSLEDDMTASGLRLSADDIYSINKSSLKDAIVHFGGGCTAEVISDQGLILTNYHCGYSQVQIHSSVENDYLTDGYWAASKSDELSNPGLTATFIVRVEDVTSSVLEGITPEMKANDRNKRIYANIGRLESSLDEGEGIAGKIRPFFYGNEYYMIVTKTFNDVRLVGAPPSSIGKFGGDTDNWVWPRHTGDFALFRIYAGQDNGPSEYSEGNRPYTPVRSLQISLDGVNEGDFSMVYGFPGRTQQYLHSDAVNYVMNISNPAKIEMRRTSLEIIDKDMAASDEVRIKYAAKQSRISNAYKKWIGQNFGLERKGALAIKKQEEARFLSTLNENSDLKSIYGTVLSDLSSTYDQLEKYELARDYFIEYVYYGPEFLRFANSFDKLVNNYDTLLANGMLDQEVEKLRGRVMSHFKNYNVQTDKRLFEALTPLYMKGVDNKLLPGYLGYTLDSKFKGKVSVLGDKLYGASYFVNEERMLTLLDKIGKGAIKKLSKDPAFQLSSELFRKYRGDIGPMYNKSMTRVDELMRSYVKAQQLMYPDKNFWADANGTLRLTHGKVEGSSPRDGVRYSYRTTLNGVIDKYVEGDRDFDLPARLIELHEKKQYGQYADAQTGELAVCFTGSNHTSGGNSGSPALDADGRLVGLNFDRSWESTMSDIMFDPEICRNIMVDIRYVLFIIDEYAGADHIIAEMDLVKTK